MRRFLLALWISAFPVLMSLSAGCSHHPKVDRSWSSERVIESEPQTVSPGEPVVE
jgi:hypothetical protein